MDNKIPVMPLNSYMLVGLQESLLDNAAETKRELLEAKVKPHLWRIDGNPGTEAYVRALAEIVHDVLMESGGNFKKDAAGFATVTGNDIKGNCIIFNLALKLLMEKHGCILDSWGVVILKDMLSRYVHHFATLVKLPDGSFVLIDPVYRAHTKQLALTHIEIGKLIWLEPELETHKALMIYPFKRLALSQQNFWVGVSLFSENKYEAANEAFKFAMSILGEQGGMLQAMLSSNLQDEMGRYGKINPEYTFNVGLAMYRQDRVKEAEIYFRFAHSMVPNNPHYCYFAACASQAMGRLGEAEYFFQKFVEHSGLDFYGDEDVSGKIRLLRREMESEEWVNANTIGLIPEESREIDELFWWFTNMVANHAPVPYVQGRILASRDLISDLFFSLSDLVALHLDLADVYQVETSTFDTVTNIGEMFNSIIMALVEQVRPSSRREIIDTVRRRTGMI